MTAVPNVVRVAAGAISRLCDFAGVAVLIWLGWRMFFDFDSVALQTPALIVGAIGIAAACANPTSLKSYRWPLFLFAYVGIALISSIVHEWPAVAPDMRLKSTALVEPAFHLVVMAVFVTGAACLLRTERRLSVFVVLFVGAVLISAAQMVFDRAVYAPVFVRAGTVSFPSIPQWGGVHGNSLVLSLGFALAIAISQGVRPALPFAAGIGLGAALLGAAYVNGSRAGLLTMFLVAALMGAFVLNKRLRLQNRQLAMLALGAVVLVVAVAILSGRTSIGDFDGRGPIWSSVADLIGENAWLGVGPGKYAQAMRERYAAVLGPSEGILNAHNMPLHVGAEIGVAGVLCLLAFFVWLVRACHAAWSSRHVPAVSLGLSLALLGFLLHSASENFLDARADVERTRLIVWMCLAAALAVAQLPRSESISS